MRIMTYIVQTVTHVASEYDAPKIDARLNELGRLIGEFKQAKRN